MCETKNRLLTFTQFPQFREADADGLVGLRGYMSYFQDSATRFMHNLHLGNDTLPEEQGICWIYSKYKMHIFHRVGFTTPLQLECWVEEKKPAVRLYQDLTISSCGDICAVGRLEECLLDMKTQKLCRLSAIGWDGRFALDRKVELAPFARIRKPDQEALQTVGSHLVGYTDLDKSGHMNNLRYVDAVLNAFDSSFWAAHQVVTFEMHYLDQCFEGEELSLLRGFDGERAEVHIIKEDGHPAAMGLFELRAG